MPPGEDIVDSYLAELFESCERAEGLLLVAASDNEIAGYGLLLSKVRSESVDDGDIEYGLVRDLIVLPRFRGQGIGGMLLTALENAAIDRRVQWLRIEVLESNTVAKKIYLSRGFNPYITTLEKML